jgi:iron complex outermembrane receptor protein
VIRGHVTDAATHQPIAGATITVGSRGALAKDDGAYFIADAPAGSQTVMARMLGYAEGTRTVTVAVGDTVVVDFTLQAQAVNLSQVVVVGYGEERAGNITGAVKQVNSDKFNTGTVVTPQELIQSKVAGVQVVDNNMPGGGLSVRIRGATSINASSDPLFVIDGMPIGTGSASGTGSGGGISAGNDPLNFLNPNDIESITVLKDASAAAIYGANAANGVVLIKTKSGRGGPHVTYSASVSGSSVTRLPDMLSADQFRTAVEQFAPQNANQLGNANTDWFSLIDRTGWGQQHNITVAGEGQSNSYRI